MPLPLLALAPLAASLAGEFAPGLVRWIAGDEAGEVAGKVIDTVRRVTGIEDPETAIAALRADAALQAQLRVELAKLDLELERLYQLDRDSARRRDVEVRKAAGGHNYRADLMLSIAAALVGLIVWALWQGRLDMPEVVINILAMIVGALLKMIGDAFQFEFGSSRGSKDKDQLLDRLPWRGKAD